MSRNNDVFQVLVTSGDADILAAGNTLEDLAVGQIGFFNYDTNLSIDDLTVDGINDKKFYIAVGVDEDGDTVLDNVVKSAGTHIQKRNVVSLAGRCYTPAQPKIVDFKNFEAACDEDYGLKFEIRNQQAYRVNGFNQVVKSFVVTTGACDDCETCPTGNCIELAESLVTEVNLDEDALIEASLIAQSAITIVTHGTSADYADGEAVSDADVAVLKVFNETADAADVVCLGIRFTVQAGTFASFCNINLNYFYPRSTDIVPVAIGGFEGGNGAFTVTQDIVYEEGSGYDVRQMEYDAGGFNGKPGIYRVSTLNGVAREGFSYLASNTEKYDLIQLAYDQASIAGWQEHRNNLRTVIAIPTGDTTTRNAVATFFGASLTQFADLTAYMATCPGDGTTVNISTDGGETFVDGIGTV